MAAERRPGNQLLLQGVVAGLVAGLVFIVAEVLVTAALGGSVFAPLLLIASIVLGPAALPPFPAVDVATAALIGVVVHAVLATLYGVVFVYLLATLDLLGARSGVLVLFGAVFGFLLYVVNFLVIAPAFFPQFTQVDQFWQGSVPHVVFFGVPLGGYVAVARPGVVAASRS